MKDPNFAGHCHPPVARPLLRFVEQGPGSKIHPQNPRRDSYSFQSGRLPHTLKRRRKERQARSPKNSFFRLYDRLYLCGCGVGIEAVNTVPPPSDRISKPPPNSFSLSRMPAIPTPTLEPWFILASF